MDFERCFDLLVCCLLVGLFEVDKCGFRSWRSVLNGKIEYDMTKWYAIET